MVEGGIEDEALVAPVVVDETVVEVGEAAVEDSLSEVDEETGTVDDRLVEVGREVVEVGEVAVEDSLSEVGEEACTVDGRLVEVGGEIVDGACVEDGGGATMDEPLADTKGVIEDESFGKGLELTAGLAEVAKVVGVASGAPDDA